MRTIKFRGAHDVGLHNTEMYYGDLVERYGDFYISYLIQFEYKLIDVYSDSVGQFTGFCDSKGYEIYEGDIIKSIEQGKTRIADVRWGIFSDFDFACETWIIDNEPLMTFIERKNNSNNESQIFKVIGNIFQNQDLLEVIND